VEAFEAFDGVPQEILYDRMKTAVIGEDAEGRVLYNRGLLDVARHYGFQPRACQPYRAKTKGKVELLASDVQRVKAWQVSFSQAYKMPMWEYCFCA
jgi:transposase